LSGALYGSINAKFFGKNQSELGEVLFLTLCPSLKTHPTPLAHLRMGTFTKILFFQLQYFEITQICLPYNPYLQLSSRKFPSCFCTDGGYPAT